jgi:hypothetical protein
MPVAWAQAPVASPSQTSAIAPPKETQVKHRATGTFDVTVVPLTEGVRKDAWAPGRMSIDKRFQGDLEGVSQGEMLAAMTGVKGSGGYTAIEQVRGKLNGRNGTFMLQHSAVMSHGVVGDWVVRVIPDSGTEGLQGLAGTLTITIVGGKHSYALEYTLPAEGGEAGPQR